MSTKNTLRALVGFARGHRSSWARGLTAALGVVGLRLALPWTVEALARPLLAGDASAALHTGSTQLVPGLLFLGVAVALGFADHLERLWFARFSIGLVRDLRAEAFAGLMRSSSVTWQGRQGDMVARLVGDSARVKAGIKGFLVHVATNGVVFLGVAVVFMHLYWPIGLTVLIGGLMLAAVTTYSASRIYERASKYRKREGQLAEAIHGSLGTVLPRRSFSRLNRSSGDHEAALTQQQGRATWAAHLLFGVTILVAFALGLRGLSNGETTIRTLVILTMYALVMRVPMVQLARQGTRTGKILASARRLVSLVGEGRDEGKLQRRRLKGTLELRDLTLRSTRRLGRKRRLGPLNLKFIPGQSVVVLGPPGSGKTSLLECLAGIAEARRGEIVWDGTPRSAPNLRERLGSTIGFQPDEPAWPNFRLSKLLEIHRVSEARLEQVVEACGLMRLLEKLPEGIHSKVASSDLGSGDRRALAVARAALRGAPLQLFDQPTAGLSKRQAKRRLERLVALTPKALRVVALSRPSTLSYFDRIIELKKGRVVFDGPPEHWQERQRLRQTSVRLVSHTSSTEGVQS